MASLWLNATPSAITLSCPVYLGKWIDPHQKSFSWEQVIPPESTRTSLLLYTKVAWSVGAWPSPTYLLLSLACPCRPEHTALLLPRGSQYWFCLETWRLPPLHESHLKSNWISNYICRDFVFWQKQQEPLSSRMVDVKLKRKWTQASTSHFQSCADRVGM